MSIKRSIEEYRAGLRKVAATTRDEFLSPEGFDEAEALYAQHLEDTQPLFPVEVAGPEPGLDVDGDPLEGGEPVE